MILLPVFFRDTDQDQDQDFFLNGYFLSIKEGDWKSIKRGEFFLQKLYKVIKNMHGNKEISPPPLKLATGEYGMLTSYTPYPHTPSPPPLLWPAMIETCSFTHITRLSPRCLKKILNFTGHKNIKWRIIHHGWRKFYKLSIFHISEKKSPILSFWELQNNEQNTKFPGIQEWLNRRGSWNWHFDLFLPLT